MGEDERVVGQLRERAKRLIEESEQVNTRLATALPAIVAAAGQCRAATDHYLNLHARGGERQTLLDLAARVGQRSIIFARRSEIAAEQYAVERELKHINGWIGATQLAIGAGKLAEMILGMLAWCKHTRTVIDLYNKSRLELDALKAAQTQAAMVLTVNGKGKTGPADYVMGTAQLGAYLLRVTLQLEKTGKHLWDLLGLARRAASCTDLSQAASTVMQEFKVLVDLMKSLVEAIDNAFGPDGKPVKSGLPPALGNVSVALTALRDLIDGARAFYGAYTAFCEFFANAERMERAMQASIRHTGSEQAALARLPVLQQLDPGAIETLAQGTSTFNDARVLVDAARKEAQKIKDDMDAANALVSHSKRTLRQALRAVGSDLGDMEELLVRLRYQMQDLGFVRDRGGPRATAARELIGNLERQRDRLQAPFGQLKALAVVVN